MTTYALAYGIALERRFTLIEAHDFAEAYCRYYPGGTARHCYESADNYINGREW